MILLVYLSRHRVLNILKREEKIRTDSEDDEGDFHEDTYSIVGKSEAEEDERNNSAEKRDPLFSDFKRLLTWTQLSLSALRAHQTSVETRILSPALSADEINSESDDKISFIF